MAHDAALGVKIGRLLMGTALAEIGFTPFKESAMNWERIEGNWKQITGKVKEKWGRLTDDDVDVIAGRRDQLSGRIQERYGIAKDDADRQISDWENTARDDWFVH